jgi:hypothetical protein
MTERKIVSPAELNAWLTGEIRKVNGCHECELTWKYRLRYPEQHGGCNWSELCLRLGKDADLRVAAKAASEIEACAFKLFNLEEEQPPAPRAPAKELVLEMRRRLLYTPIFHLDANLINAKQKLAAVNQLEKWRDDEVICLAMAGIAHAEAQAGEGVNAEARKSKAASHIFTIKDAGQPEEDDTYAKVEGVLWGKAADNNQANDVEVVCEAIKWHAILITNDGESKSQPGGILGNREKLHQQFGVLIYRPEEAVQFIKSKVAERDQFNAQVAASTEMQTPAWTGQD